MTSLHAFPGFRSLQTHHCVTGSLLHVYRFHGLAISEDMLLGIGSGVGFIYWHARGTDPMLGGRANVGRPGEVGLEITCGLRTGVRMDRHRTGSARKAEAGLLACLEAGEPVMLQVDMGFLPYFQNLPVGFHFGYHMVVAAGFDAATRQVLLADRDLPLHPVALADLSRARGSTFRPFPPNNTWYTFDFSGKRQPRPEEVRQALREVCAGMLDAPIANLGVRGIAKAAGEVRRWPGSLQAEDLRRACLSSFLFIDAAGGTGGGLFRRMYGRFLKEAAALLAMPELAQAGGAMLRIGDAWQQVASRFQVAAGAADPREALESVPPQLIDLAEREAQAWEGIRRILAPMPVP